MLTPEEIARIGLSHGFIIFYETLGGSSINFQIREETGVEYYQRVKKYSK
ncbi:MAG: hypothetical protein J4428_02985 [Candidatus Aenigmarchaeota archaeon]|nr:hypothetical protein [Candidatus Aenigmarchaeota archaeon]